MEFFRYVRGVTNAALLMRELTIDRLPEHCSVVDNVLSSDGDRGEIYCLWGQFQVHRECINGGVRFTLPGCPNALAWTVTRGLPPIPESTLIHCTINRREHEPDFIASIDLFLDAMAAGIAALPQPGAANTEE